MFFASLVVFAIWISNVSPPDVTELRSAPNCLPLFHGQPEEEAHHRTEQSDAQVREQDMPGIQDRAVNFQNSCADQTREQARCKACDARGKHGAAAQDKP